YGEPKLDAGV
uniref:Pneumadin n=1 Tax=Rattus norvegicus TaxID=10116 RepID=PNEU_RAT|nr:RecName: Full=Pneumadin; Short=PNM [Rattus norvegicus]